MVARKFLVLHNDSNFDVDYDTDDGFEVFQFQLFSLTSVPPEDQKIVCNDDGRLVSTESDLLAISEKLRLVSVSDDAAELMKSDEELAQRLQAEEEALMVQQFVAGSDNENFENRIRPYVHQVRMYEDPIRQEAARKTAPIEDLREKAIISLGREGNFKPSKFEEDHAFLLQLLFWFKRSFRWVNAPPCDGCANETINQGMGNALPLELQFGASRVELFRCNSCGRTTRFPRYNDPLKLVETRRGRCGEWANCFTLYCRAFGYDSRLILDFTDHVWTECFSQSLGRWMHLDPCEAVYDKPLLYEKGWNKKLNYTIAIAKDGVYDVTKRYTRNWHEVLSRRNLIPEKILSNVLANITRECRANFTPQVLSVLEERDGKEIQELKMDSDSKDDSLISLPGRQSGDKEWRKARLEIGSDDNDSLGISECPVRKCSDEHVTRIYDAFNPVLSQFVEEELSKPRAIQVLEFIKETLIALKKSPFKTRRVSVDPDVNGIKPLVLRLFPFFKELLNALSLSSKLDHDGRIDISLAGEPVYTSLALPVVFDALDETIDNIRKCNNFDKTSLSLPLLKLNRLHSGSVLASGEELPFGIATSAFDGVRLSKWEEPNGARGCWIIYKLMENQRHDLVAYELRSANDAPERDPMNWVVEGSDNGGSSWYLLDEQTGQTFKNRHQRMAFKVTSKGHLSNAFRFRFLAARNIESTSRLQIGSIDLYA